MNLHNFSHVYLPNDLELTFLLGFCKNFCLFSFGGFGNFHRFLPYCLRRNWFGFYWDVFLCFNIFILNGSFQYFLLYLHTIALLRVILFFFLENVAILVLHTPIPLIPIVIQDLIDQTLVIIHQLLLFILIVIIKINAFRLLFRQVPLPDLLLLQELISIFLISYPFLGSKRLRGQILLYSLEVFCLLSDLFLTILSFLLNPMSKVVLDTLQA